MKKLLLASSILACLAITLFVVPTETATLANTGDQLISIPSNIWSIPLHSRSTAASVDTFAIGEDKMYGPFSLTKFGGGPMAKYLCFKGDVVTGTTPVLDVYFQVISGTSITDTISAWTLMCEIATTAKDTVYDISGLVGKSIVFRIDNDDATQSEIPGLLEFYLKDVSTEYISVK